MIEKDKRQDLNDLATPQPINVKIDADFIGFVKGDKEICKFGRDDEAAMFDAMRFLNGIIQGELVLGEIEQLRDLLTEVIGS